MTDNNPHQDPDQFDRLLQATAHGDPATTNSLTELLAAAATPDPERALTGEERMLAEYRTATPPTANSARKHHAMQAAVAATLAALFLCGIAAAARHPQPRTAPARPQLQSSSLSPTPYTTTHQTTPPISTNKLTTTPSQQFPSSSYSRPQQHAQKHAQRAIQQPRQKISRKPAAFVKIVRNS